MMRLVPKSSAPLSGRTLSVIPYIALLAYGLAFAAAAIGAHLPVYDDHPGQLYRLRHVLTHGPAPWAWNPGWWTGYPELQFYPPAFAYAGALLHWISLGTLTPATAYVALLWLAYLAPGVTTLFALARVQRSAWLALPGAFVALTLSLWPALMSGVEGGVHVGMAPARLAWALLPLLLGVLAPWADGAARFPARSVVVLAAAIGLTHPAHLPAAVALVVLAALLASPRGPRLLIAVAWLGLAALVTAFWSLPLLARLGETRALAWGRLADALRPPGSAILGILGVVVIFSLVPLWRSGIGSVQLTAGFPWLAGTLVALDAVVLERVGFRSLPADRLMDAVWLGVVLAGSVGAGGIHGLDRTLAARRWLGRHEDVKVGLVLVLLVLALTPFDGALTLWPRAADWPTYSPTVGGLRMDALWQALRSAPPGRVLFVRASVPLVYGTTWWRPHTHLPALTPATSGREIVNGTFTHPSPVAALVYRGDAGRGAITELVERLDGASLFGRPLESLDTATLNAYARALRVSTIVALEDDLPRLAALADNPLFRTRRAEPPFVLWLGPATTLPERTSRGRWRVRLEATDEGWASAGLAYYPLWRASASGRVLETRRGINGDLQVRAAAGSTIELTYGPGAPEIAGLVLTALGVVAAAVGPRYLSAAAPASEHS
jgi:hypothetical protein